MRSRSYTDLTNKVKNTLGHGGTSCPKRSFPGLDFRRFILSKDCRATAQSRFHPHHLGPTVRHIRSRSSKPYTTHTAPRTLPKVWKNLLGISRKKKEKENKKDLLGLTTIWSCVIMRKISATVGHGSLWLGLPSGDPRGTRWDTVAGHLAPISFLTVIIYKVGASHTALGWQKIFSVL